MSKIAREEARWPAIRDARLDDAARLAEIYNHYVSETIVTFETEPVTDGHMAARITEAGGERLPWLVADAVGTVSGFAFASKWKGRCAYRYAVESTIYVSAADRSRGIGMPLYAALIEHLRDAGMHAVIAGISLPNDASVRLHEKLGFEKIGHFREVGRKFDSWIDVGYWELLL